MTAGDRKKMKIMKIDGGGITVFGPTRRTGQAAPGAPDRHKIRATPPARTVTGTGTGTGSLRVVTGGGIADPDARHGTCQPH